MEVPEMGVAAVKKILGGHKVLQKSIQNRMDLIELCKNGIARDALVHLAKYMGISMHQLSRILPVTERTIQRCAPGKPLSRIVSEHIIQIAEVAARGTDIFGDKDRFLAWMKIPNLALSNRTPLSLLNSRLGTEMVLDELGRIEHGVFS